MSAKLSFTSYLEVAPLIQTFGASTILAAPGFYKETETTNQALENASTKGGLGVEATFGHGNGIIYSNVVKVDATGDELSQFGHVRGLGTPATIDSIDNHGVVHATIVASGAQSATRSNFNVDWSDTVNAGPNFFANHEMIMNISHKGAGTPADPGFNESYLFYNGPQGIGGYDSTGHLVLGIENYGTPGYNLDHIGDSVNIGTKGAFAGSSNLAAGDYVVTLTELQTYGHIGNIQLTGVVATNTVDYHVV